MKALKAYFLSLQARERILITVFLALGAAIALTFFTKRASAFWRVERAKLATIRQNDAVIAKRDAVDKRALAASSRLVPGESLTQLQLNSRVTTYATNAGIRNPAVNGVLDEVPANSNLAIHKVRLTASNVAWTNLRDFYVELQKRRPYISIDDMNVSVADQRTGMHSVTMTLSSIEVKQ
jgi:hypothetical protein